MNLLLQSPPKNAVDQAIKGFEVFTKPGEFPDASLAASHEVYFQRLDTLATGTGFTPELISWRFMVLSGETTVGVIEVHPKAGGKSYEYASFGTGGGVDDFVAGIHAAEAANFPGEYTVKALFLPGLTMSLLWFPSETEPDLYMVHNAWHYDLVRHQLYTEAELFPLLAGYAQERLVQEDSLGA